MFDKDGNGLLQIDELKEIFAGQKMVSDEVLKEIIKEVNINGDGFISYIEFKDMMFQFINMDDQEVN